jgi:hypothetical protein
MKVNISSDHSRLCNIDLNDFCELGCQGFRVEPEVSIFLMRDTYLLN